jgi:hypothetical protein
MCFSIEKWKIPPFAEKRNSSETSNTDRNTNRPVKSDTGKIPIPKNLLVTPFYTTLSKTNKEPAVVALPLVVHEETFEFNWARGPMVHLFGSELEVVIYPG